MDIPDERVSQYTNRSESTIHHALRASRRRVIVGLLANESLQVSGATDRYETTVRDLSKAVTAIEQNTSLTEATGESYRSVYNSMIQTHLPELDGIQAITYDADRKTVTPEDNLIPLAMVAAITSPVAQMLFHNGVADLYSEGRPDLQDSIGD